MDLKKIADYLENKIYYMLLFTVAIIPLRQEFTAFCVGITFICAVLVSFSSKERKPFYVFNFKQQALLYLLLIIGVVSLFFSMDGFLSAWNYLYVAGQYAAIFFVLLRYGCREQQVLKKEIIAAESCYKHTYLYSKWHWFSLLPRPLQLINIFLSVSILVSTIGILQKIFGVTAEGIWIDPAQFPDIKVRVFSTLVNPNILAGYLVLVIAYSTAFFSLSSSYKKLRLFYFVVGSLAAVCLLYTYSRGNWLACVAVLIAFCILFCRKAFIPVLSGMILSLAVGGTAVLHRLESIRGGYGGDTSIALRMAYLKSTKWIIEEFPLGVGWYGYRFVYPTYNFYLADKNVIMYHCHNIFLNVLAELGWHGLVVFLFIWWGVFLPAAWKLAYHGRLLWMKAMGRGYVLATVGIAVGGLTDHVYFNTQMGLLFWTIGALTMVTAKINSLDK